MTEYFEKNKVEAKMKVAVSPSFSHGLVFLDNCPFSRSLYLIRDCAALDKSLSGPLSVVAALGYALVHRRLFIGAAADLCSPP